VVLRDRVGGYLADVRVPFKVRRAMNEATHVAFTLDHEDEAAALLIAELSLGIPQIAAYRDGVLWARGWWHPMEESAGQDGTSMGCVFRGPFAELETRTRAASYQGATLQGAVPTPLTKDQATHVQDLYRFHFTAGTGLWPGGTYLSVTRDRAYPADKNIAEAIMQLTEVENGPEFLERPIDDLTRLSDGAPTAILAELDVGGTGQFGSDKSDSVIFEHGFGASNVVTVNRQIGRPVNYVKALGAEYVIESGTFKGTYRYAAVVQNTASIDLYKRQSVTLELPDITRVATLQEHAGGALRLSPPQAVTFTPDASGDIQPTDYWIGDRIRLVAARDALQIDMTARVRSVEIEVDADGNETHNVEIGDQRVQPLTDKLRGLARVQRALARHETPQGS
jgi:hypothetical protein